jgi:hypothetical protein
MRRRQPIDPNQLYLPVPNWDWTKPQPAAAVTLECDGRHDQDDDHLGQE